MKRSTKSLLLMALLAALLGSYTLINHVNRQAEISEESGNFMLTEHNDDELTGLIWINDDREYHFEKDENGWHKKDDSDFPTDQEAVQSLADRLVTMEATRKLTDVEKLEDYGFNDDSYSVTAEWFDGTTTRYILGDETPFSDGYYTRIDGENGVIYTATSKLSSMFAETDIDLAKLEEIPTIENPSALAIGSDLDLYYQETSSNINPDQHWYSIDDEPMDDEAVDSVISDIKTLEWQSLVNVNADEETLTDYQLDDASASIISMTGDDGVSMELLIGASNDEGDYYAKLSDSVMVYTLDGETIEILLETTVDSLLNMDVFPLEYENVQEFTCTLNDSEILFQPTHTSESDDNEVSDDVESDAANSEEDPAKSIWEQIHSLYASSRSDEIASGEILLKITVSNTEGISANYRFYSYDVDSYLVANDEAHGLLVSADDVDKLIRTLRQMQ